MPPSSGQRLLLSGQSYRNFIETVHSHFTRISYRNSLQLYLRHRNVSESCEELLQGDPRLIQSQIIDYVIHLREELNLSSSTINNRVAAVKKFYETNDIELKWRKIKSYIGKGKGARKKDKKDRAYTHDEIQRMLEKADQRGRIAILLMATAGLRVGALPSLKIRDLQQIEKYSIFKVTVYDNDQGEYITFCSPRCAQEINSYLEYRQRHNEHPLNEDAPLIREEFDIHDEIKAAKPKSLGVESFRKMIKDIGLRSGVIERRAIIDNGRGPRRPVRETHGFRKAFHTCALNAGMSPLYVEILLGHTSGLSLESYMRPTETDLLEGNDMMIGYAGIIDALPPLDESQKLRREVETLRVEKSSWESLREEVEGLKALLKQG